MKTWRCLWFALLGVSSACAGPDLNLGDSDGLVGGNANIPSQAGSTSGGNKTNNAGGTAGSNIGGASAGSSGTGTGGGNPGGGPNVGTPRIDVMPFSANSALRSVYVGTDASIWVGNTDVNTYSGSWAYGSEKIAAVTAEITDLWGDGARPSYAATTRGVYGFDGTGWKFLMSGESQDPIRLSVTTNYVYVAFNSYNDGVRRIERKAGALEELCAGAAFLATNVWAFSDKEVLALLARSDEQGAAGSFQMFNGGDWASDSSWSSQLVGRGTAKNETIRDLWSSNGEKLLAVGTKGAALRGKGTTWAQETTGTTANLNAAWGSVADGDFVVGDNGTVLFFDGTKWISLASGTTANLRAIHGRAGGPIVAVGDGGTVLNIILP